jgi:valyl-tRNA synthetase
MYADDKKLESIHVSSWPTSREELVDEEVEEKGDLIVAVMGEIRRNKAENQKPLNVPIKKLTLYIEDKQKADILANAEEDLAGTLKVEQLVIKPKGKGREIKGCTEVYFDAEY